MLALLLAEDTMKEVHHLHTHQRPCNEKMCHVTPDVAGNLGMRMCNTTSLLHAEIAAVC